MILSSGTPSIINNVYNSIFTWDGRNKSLIEQAIAPIVSAVEMNKDIEQIIK